MRAALADAALSPRDLGFVNLHGTGTVYNDAMELAALRRLYGISESAALPVCAFSTKPLTGHCLGAAGAIEAALCCLRLISDFSADADNQQLTTNSFASYSLSNSFAFGGSNATVIFGR